MALGVQANARTQREWLCVAVEYMLINWPNCTKLGCYLPPLRVHLESPYFATFSANAKKKKRDSHGKLRNCHGKVMEKYFVKSVGTLVHIPLL